MNQEAGFLILLNTSADMYIIKQTVNINATKILMSNVILSPNRASFGSWEVWRKVWEKEN